MDWIGKYSINVINSFLLLTAGPGLVTVGWGTMLWIAGACYRKYKHFKMDSIFLAALQQIIRALFEDEERFLMRGINSFVFSLLLSS